METLRKCADCAELKHVTAFALRRKGSASYAAYCKVCSSRKAVEWARKNRVRHAANVKAWRLANPGKVAKPSPEKSKQYSRASYARNAEKRRQAGREYYAKNKVEQAEAYKAWRLKNPGKNAAKSMAYEARKKQAMPRWADQAAIQEVYERCAAMNAGGGPKYQVDHFYPLASPEACGLHVHYNLQIIPAVENQRKSNRLPTI